VCRLPISSHTYAVAENYLQQDLQLNSWLYLTTVIDLADRKVIGWALSETMKAVDTTVAALKMVIGNRPVVQPLLFHSDREVYSMPLVSSLISISIRRPFDKK